MKRILLITSFLLLGIVSKAQIVVIHFNADWNEANSVKWVDDLEDCDIEHIDMKKAYTNSISRNTAVLDRQ